VAASTHLLRPTHDEKRAKLSRHFAAAIEPMLEHSPYSELKIEAIIKAGGISRTTFYVYFNDKADLLRAMVDSIVDDLHAVAFWRVSDDADKEELREGLRGVVATYGQHRLLLRALVEAAGYDRGLRKLYDGIVAQGVANVATHIERGQRNGTVDPSLAPEGTARLLVFMGERALYQTLGVHGEDDDAVLLDPLTDVFWRTLYAGYR
jgi:AcrR family transcriptional regulator